MKFTLLTTSTSYKSFHQCIKILTYVYLVYIRKYISESKFSVFENISIITIII